jgi:hypothetical protein
MKYEKNHERNLKKNVKKICIKREGKMNIIYYIPLSTVQ